jgi:single-stranded-DNA-specific exonuclease
VTARDPAALEAARAAILGADHVVPHDDADGLAAAALVLRARRQDARAAVLLDRTQTPWGLEPDLPDGSVALLDQGVRPFARPGVLVDHHVPETDAPGPDVVVVSSYGEVPETPTAPLTQRVIGGPAWLAAIGAAGDLGRNGLQLPEAAGVSPGAIMKAVPLLNAPRRCVGGPVRTALSLLVDHDSPEALLGDPRVRVLERSRQAVKTAFDRAVRTAPTFHGDVAVLRICVPYLVHPLVATAWSRRLAPRPVLCANDGWIPGRVTFAARTASDTDLRALLREALPDAEGELGNGHRRATGGRLAPAEFDRLLAAFEARDVRSSAA